MIKTLLIFAIALNYAGFAQTPIAPGCKQTPTTLEASGQANKVTLQSSKIVNSPSVQKGVQVMQQLLASLATDSKFNADKTKMQQHIQGLAQDTAFQKQKADMDAKRMVIEGSAERAQKLAKFQSDVAGSKYDILVGLRDMEEEDYCVELRR